MSEWLAEEIDVVVDSYLDMLRQELSDEPYVKIAHNREVQEATKRSKGSVEFKYANISAVLDDAGLVYIDGYKPRSSYQAALADEITRRRDRGELDWIPRAAAAEAPTKATAPQQSIPPIAAALAPASEDPAAPAVDTSGEAPRYRFEQALGLLPGLALGGVDVAVDPTTPGHDFWPVGPAAAAADEVVAWLRQRGQGTTDEPVLCFLVGGPGNGKSHQSRAIVEGLEVPTSATATDLAQRTYRYTWPAGRDLVVVNDATIPRDDEAPAPLLADIEEALEAGSDLVASVNRGILFEERRASPDGRFLVVIDWLQGRPSPGDGISDVLRHAYIQVARVAIGGKHALALAVFMDACSLLESRPTIAASQDDPGAWQADGYEVKRFRQRDTDHASTTAAGDVLAALIERIEPPSRDDPADPFAANLLALRDPSTRTGLLSLVRAAEIAASARLTYRDLWGAIVRMLVGDAPDRVPSRDVKAYLATLGTDLDGMLARAELRAHQALFGAAPWSSNGEPPRAGPVTGLLRAVDPVRDARPGRPGDGELGWADPVLEAFQAHASGQSPLAILLDRAAAGDPVHGAVTPFEGALDDSIVAALGGLDDKPRRELVGWYGEYLLRLYASAHGIPAFHPEIDAWTRAWKAGHRGRQLHVALRQALLTLLLPPLRPGKNATMLPFLDSRTVPLLDDPGSPTLVVRVESSWKLAPRVVSDRIDVGVIEQGKEVFELELDFPLVREALACAEQRVGITEHATTASPRLERFRAALLRPTDRQPLAVINGIDELEIEVDA